MAIDSHEKSQNHLLTLNFYTFGKIISMKAFYSVALSCLILISCGKKEQYHLAFRLPVGQEIEIYQNQTMDMENFMGEKSKAMKTTSSTWFSWNVQSISKDSSLDVKHVYKRYLSNIAMDDSVKVIDSDIPSTLDGVDENEEYASFYALVGKNIDLTLNKQGKTVDMRGLDELKNDFLKDSSKYGKIMGRYLNDLSNESMKSQFATFHIYPEKPVKIGDTWNTDWSMSMGITFQINYTYTLKSVVGDTAIIDISGLVSTSNSDTKIDTKNPLAALAKMMTITGNYVGEIKSNIKTGLIYKNEQTFDVKAEINMFGMKMPMNMKGSSSLNMKSKI